MRYVRSIHLGMLSFWTGVINHPLVDHSLLNACLVSSCYILFYNVFSISPVNRLPLDMAGVSVPSVIPDVSLQKETNIAAFCRIGQDLVQELVQKVTDVFQNLKLMTLPYGTAPSNQASQRSSAKLNENLKQIELHFLKLRHVYKECQRRLPDDVEQCVLVPYVSQSQGMDAAVEELPILKSSKQLALELRKKELEAILTAKNDHLKRLVDEMRELVWEINSVLALHRRP